MTEKKELLGKIFISHSSLDKPFVRKLRKKLETDGYGVWLDEKDMVVGDPLSSSIFKAIEDAHIFLVIISSAAIKSKWLKFELNAATEKMVQGKCRVIPIIIENVSLPGEVRGLLYSDFSRSSRDGYKQIITALEYEYQERKKNLSFWHRSQMVANEVFGSAGYISTLGSYKSLDYSVFDLPFARKDKNNLNVVFEIVSDYSHKAEPLDSSWWYEYDEVNQKNDYEYLFLVITERPVNFSVDATSKKSKRVKQKKLGGLSNRKQIAVFVDLSSIEIGKWKKHLEVARNELINYSASELDVLPIE
jgi:hypothetical protein